MRVTAQQGAQCPHCHPFGPPSRLLCPTAPSISPPPWMQVQSRGPHPHLSVVGAGGLWWRPQPFAPSASTHAPCIGPTESRASGPERLGSHRPSGFWLPAPYPALSSPSLHSTLGACPVFLPALTLHGSGPGRWLPGETSRDRKERLGLRKPHNIWGGGWQCPAGPSWVGSARICVLRAADGVQRGGSDMLPLAVVSRYQWRFELGRLGASRGPRPFTPSLWLPGEGILQHHCPMTGRGPPGYPGAVCALHAQVGTPGGGLSRCMSSPSGPGTLSTPPTLIVWLSFTCPQEPSMEIGLPTRTPPH